METHGSVSIPVVTFGSAAGRMKTGMLVDYRRMGNTASQFDPGAGGKQTLGMLYSQWLATVLQAMGVPPSEFERWGTKGYGYPYITKESWTPPFGEALRRHVVALLPGGQRLAAVPEGVVSSGRSQAAAAVRVRAGVAAHAGAGLRAASADRRYSRVVVAGLVGAERADGDGACVGTSAAGSATTASARRCRRRSSRRCRRRRPGRAGLARRRR